MNNNSINPDLKLLINYYMDLYFKSQNSFDNLTEENKILLGIIDTMIASIPENSSIKIWINEKIDKYERTSAAQVNSKIRVLKNPNIPVLNEDEKYSYPKAGFINIAIILYGIFNIGMIIAIALMK